MAEGTYQGGCLSSRIRYRVSGAPHRPHYCHCRMCQRAVGSPLPAWVNFPLEDFAYTAGEPTYYRSSPELRRGFCATCGASICTIADDDAYVCVTIASLDDPERIAPAFHMWTASRVRWLKIDDELPRHEGQA
ncbi:MAG: GFA family protein [Geminicoccales bacterium]